MKAEEYGRARLEPKGGASALMSWTEEVDFGGLGTEPEGGVCCEALILLSRREAIHVNGRPCMAGFEQRK